MGIYKAENGTWFVSCSYEDWTGKKSRKVKRGFKTKKEANEWESNFMVKNSGNLEMNFREFTMLYVSDIRNRLRVNTWLTKKAIIEKKILPYFENKRVAEIKPLDIIKWQNAMMDLKGNNNKPFSQTYLRTINNQISAIFNHAVRFYNLKENPAQKAGHMGQKESREMLFWTKEEYMKFSEQMMKKPMSFYAFEMLYWCGIRLGELLALTPADFDFKKKKVSITKSYQRLNGEDIITDPKTPKSIRVVQMPDFLCEEMKDYINSLYEVSKDERIFPINKKYLHYEMDRGSKEAGIKRIRLHDLRHSHVSLLIDMGFSAVAIANRVGHESIDITYRYAHMLPTAQLEMANKLDEERMNNYVSKEC